MTKDELLKVALELNNSKEFQKAADLLTPELLAHFNNAELYAEKAKSCSNLKDFDGCLIAARKALELDETNAKAHHYLGNYLSNHKNLEDAIKEYNRAIEIDPKLTYSYHGRGNVYAALKEFDKAVLEYSKAIEIDPNFAPSYNSRGNSYFNLREFDKAIYDFSQALEIDPNYHVSYSGRGRVYHTLKQHNKAIQDFSRAIEIDPGHSFSYNGRGIVYHTIKQYSKAIQDFSKAIEIDPKNSYSYNSRGNTYKSLKKYNEAIQDYSSAIKIDPKYSSPYYGRSDVFEELNQYNKSISDLKQFLSLRDDKANFWVQKAQSRLTELNKKLKDNTYQLIDQIIEQIKTILRFNENCLTHYTSLSSAQAMILKGSSFRLSEGAYLNDTSEGRELFNFLNFHLQVTDNKTLPEIFTEKPFIGSFVSDTKHDDLTLWRMYGKEAQVEARGCAITIKIEPFLSNLSDSVIGLNDKTTPVTPPIDQFVFYRVAYLNNGNKQKFAIPTAKPAENRKLNLMVTKLKEAIEKLKEENTAPEKTQNIREQLNDIAYLFKSSEYQYEHEVRLVISGVGFEKLVNDVTSPPRVYIELVPITPVIDRVTLGPKVERADEWAAAFNYSLKKSGHQAKIIISHLPFK